MTQRSRRGGPRAGFTLIEIMIVVGIIGMLAIIIIPNYINAKRAAQKNACIANLKQIQGAIQTWAIDTGASPGSAVTTADIIPKYLKAWPKEGVFDYPVPASVNETPVCPNAATNTDHTL